MNGESVLLAEDEIPERLFLEEQLAEGGFSVLAASCARKVFDLVEADDPQLVVLEAMLPDVSGYEVCQRLRIGAPGCCWNQNVPVIIMGERNEPEDRVRAFARGADDYLARQIVYAELVARIRPLLRRSGGLPRVDRIVVGRSRSIGSTRSCASTVGASRSPARSSSCCSLWPSTPEHICEKNDLLHDVWEFRSQGARERSTRTRAGFGASSTATASSASSSKSGASATSSSRPEAARG